MINPIRVDDVWADLTAAQMRETNHRKLLAQAGWETVHVLGAGEEESWNVTLYERPSAKEKGGKEYAVEATTDISGPLLVFPSYTDAMTAVAHWAPIVQSHAVSRLVADLDERELSTFGLFERVGAKIGFGAEHWEQMLQEQEERERRRAQEDERKRREATEPGPRDDGTAPIAAAARPVLDAMADQADPRD